jgi:hypothetical protein
MLSGCQRSLVPRSNPPWVALLWFSAAVLGPLAASAQAASDPSALVPYSSEFATTSWPASDEARYDRNRLFATLGKVLTVVGRISAVSLAAAGYAPQWLAGAAVATTGELMWSISELVETNRFQARHFRVRRAAPITAVVGAFTLAPITWIAGPVASARLRDLHRDVMGFPVARGPQVWGAGLTLQF